MFKISVIVPVYNVEPYLKECLESIRNQTLSEIEIILVNDGSTDGSDEICDYYTSIDKRFIAIHKSNGGLSSARNAGLEVAKGEYIGFVDSDDWIDNKMYEVLYSNSVKKDADIAACNIARMRSDGSFTKFYRGKQNFFFTKAEAMDELIENRKISFSSCNKIFRRHLFDDFKYDESLINEDMNISYKILNTVNSVFYTNKAMYFYRYNETSITRKKFSDKKLDKYEVYKNMYDFYLEHYPNSANKVLMSWHNDNIELYIEALESKVANMDKLDFLISKDKKVLKTLIDKDSTSSLNKARLKIFLFSPNLRIFIERFIKNVKFYIKKINVFYTRASNFFEVKRVSSENKEVL